MKLNILSSLMSRFPLRGALLCIPLFLASRAHAGEWFEARHMDKRIAMEHADAQAVAHAKRRGSCYHPAVQYPVVLRDGIWWAKANAANHAGSCPRRLQRLPDVPASWEY